MSYPISPSEMERADLTASAKRLYDGFRRAGLGAIRAMRALFWICADEGQSDAASRSSMCIPTLKQSRRRAAKRMAKEMIAQGRDDATVRNETGVSDSTIRRLKRELDEEVQAERA